MSLIDPASRCIDPDQISDAADRQFWNPDHAYVEEALSLAMDDISDKELFYLHVKEGSYARAGEMLGDAAEKRIAESWQDLCERLHRGSAALEGRGNG